MTIHVIEKPVKGGTVTAAIENLQFRVTNAALHQVAEKLSAYMADFCCPDHPSHEQTGEIEVEGESITEPGAHFLTKLLTPCCSSIEKDFDNKVGDFFKQYKEED